MAPKPARAVADEAAAREAMLGPAGRWVRKGGRRVISKNFWSRRLPILGFLRTYNAHKLLSDVIAGITVGLTFIPVVMAAAAVGGLPPKYGLYASTMYYFVYAVLGSCKDVSISPTVVTALLCKPFIDKFGPEVAVTLCFYTGCTVSLIGVLNLGFVLDFISAPVLDGLLSAVAVSAISGQIQPLLGIRRGGSNFVQFWAYTLQRVEDARLWDSVLGLGCIAALLLFTYIAKFGEPRKELPGSAKSSATEVAARVLVKYVCLGRTAIVVLASTAIVASVAVDGVPPVSVAGEIEAGLPAFKPPQFTLQYENRTLSFGETVSELSSATSIPLIVVVSSIVASKAFANGESIDTTQEMIAVGVSNIMGSFVQGYPGCGSIVRAVVNNAAGVQTPLGGAFAGSVVLIALSFFTSVLEFFPSSTLAAVVICSLLSLVKIQECTVSLWRSKKSDLIPLHVTFLACLVVGLDRGMMIGIGANILLILYDAATPNIKVRQMQVGGREVVVVTPDRSVTYPAGEHVKRAIAKRSQLAPTLVIDGTHVHQIDSTSAKVLQSLLTDLGSKEQQVFLWNWHQSAVHTFTKYLKVDPSRFRYDESLELLLAPEVAPQQGEGTDLEAAV